LPFGPLPALSGVPGVGYQHHAAEDDAIHIGTMSGILSFCQILLGRFDEERKTITEASSLRKDF
jgi:hypothetical protein